MRLDIAYLRAFKVVLEQGSVTGAARSLNLSQSAVSHKLARLEDRIGRRLLQRIDGSLRPTADGRLLLSYADRLISLHDEAATCFQRSDLSGVVHLGMTESAIAANLMAVLHGFRRLHPGVEVSVRVEQSLVLDRWLNEGLVDVALLQMFVGQILPGDELLWEDDLVWVRSRDIPLDLTETVPFVSFDQHCFYRRVASEVLTDSGRTFRVVMECPSRDGVRSAVHNGMGCALMSRRDVSDDLLEITEDLPALPRICHVLRSAGRLSPELERGLCDTVIDSMRPVALGPRPGMM